MDRHSPLTPRSTRRAGPPLRRAGPWGGRIGRTVLVAVPLAFIGYFFVYPMATILLTAFTGGDGDPHPMAEVLTRRSLLGVAWFTTWQALASTLATLLVGIPGAYVLARYEFPGRSLLRTATIIPFVLPTVVVGTTFLAVMGPRGVTGVDLTRSVAAILIAHVFYNYAIVVRTVGAFWEQLDPRLEDAARSLGAGRIATFRRITLPLLAPAIASAGAIVFLFTFTSFGVILILGGLRHATIEVEIWRQATGLLNIPVAAALAVLQLVAVTAILVAYGRFQDRRGRQLRVTGTPVRTRPVGGQRWWLALNLGFMAVLLGGPLAVLVTRSLTTPSGIGLDWYRSLGDPAAAGGLFVPPTLAVANSLRFAAVATVIAVVVGVMAAAVIAYRRGLVGRGFDTLLMLPLGTSAVTLGFGFLVALDSPIDLRRSVWLIPLAHALVAIPLVVRVTVPVMRRVRTRLRDAAAVLGADPVRTWREIDLPLVSRAMAVGAGFAFAISLGEFGATSFIARPDTPTVPTAIFRLLGQPGAVTFGRAMALSVVLTVLTTVAILGIDRFRPGGSEDF